MIQLNIKKYPIVKKVIKTAFDLGRSAKNMKNTNSVFLNSIPKSGTHLAHQVMMQFNFKERYGFYASTPSWTLKIRKNSDAKKYLSSLYDRELMSGHLFYSNEMERFFKEASLPSVFIYRDPRAIFLSELNYLSNMNKWHKCHNFYKNCSSFEEQFHLCLDGIDTDIFYYPKFSKRIEDYLGWISSSEVLSIKFEMLNNHSSRFSVISEISNYLKKYSNFLYDQIGVNRIDQFPSPTRSHTYTGLSPDRWKKDLTHKQIFKLNDHLEHLVTKMGYKI